MKSLPLVSALLLSVATTPVFAAPVTTVSSDVDGMTATHGFQIDGCTPADISITSEVGATIPTDLLVGGTQNIEIKIPFVVDQVGGDCDGSLMRGATVQLQNLTGLPSFLAINTDVTEDVSVGMIEPGFAGEDTLILSLDVVGEVPSNTVVDVSLEIAAYSILDPVSNQVVNAGDAVTDTMLQATLGSPLAPATAPLVGNEALGF